MRLSKPRYSTKVMWDRSHSLALPPSNSIYLKGFCHRSMLRDEVLMAPEFKREGK
jgi:hypothetical protein